MLHQQALQDLSPTRSIRRLVNENLDQGERVKIMGKVVFSFPAGMMIFRA